MKLRYIIFALVLCLLPVTALAAIEPSQGVDRSGSTITLSGNYEEYTISGSESGVSIIVESGVKSLKLEGASITAPDGQDALTAKGSLELHAFGSNTITGGSSYKDGSSGIVLPAGGKLTINGIGSLTVNGGDSLYEGDDDAIDGTGGTAIVGSVTVLGDVHVTVTGGSCKSGYEEEEVQAGNGIDGDVILNAGRLDASGGSASSADNKNIGGHGINGNVIVHDGQLIATGGMGSNGDWSNYGGSGINGSATINGGQATVTGGQALEGRSTHKIINVGGHGVSGDVEINGGKLTVTGGQASGGNFSNNTSSENMAGHGVNGSATVNGGQLIATGSSASLSPVKNTGGNGVNGAFTIADGYALVTGGNGDDGRMGNGVNGAFTAAGGYALATGGKGDDGRMGKAAASTDEFPVTIGSSGKLMAAAVGSGTIPSERLNNGEFYTDSKNETKHVSGMRLLETKEYFTVSYSCAYDGCGNTYTDYADGSKPYTVKTPEALGFQDHGLAFAGFSDSDGNVVDSLTVSGPVALKAGWKVVFSFDAGEGGANAVPPIDVINSGSTVRLPECGIAAPDGYQFAGWKIDGSEEIYAVGDEIPAAGAIHLSAVWEPVPALPDTGDSAMPALWLLLCLASCAMLWLSRAKARS